MKIQVSKNDLENAINVASLGTSTASETSSHLFFTSKGGSVTVSASNVRVSVKTPLICQVEEEGIFGIEAWRIKKWLGAVKDQSLTLNLEGGSVVATSDKGSVKLVAMSRPLFSVEPEGVSSYTSVPSKALSEAIKAVKLFTSDKATDNAALNLICYRDDYFMATDFTSVSVAKLEGMNNFQFMHKDATPLLSFLAGEEDSVDVGVNDKMILFRRSDNSILVLGQVTHAQFPDLKTYLDSSDWPLRLAFMVDDVKTAILALTASMDKNDTKIRMVPKGEGIELRAKSVSGGDDSYYVPLIEPEGTLPEGGLTFNYHHFSKVMSIHENDVINLDIMPKHKKGTETLVGGLGRVMREGEGAMTILVLQA